MRFFAKVKDTKAQKKMYFRAANIKESVLSAYEEGFTLVMNQGVQRTTSNTVDSGIRVL